MNRIAIKRNLNLLPVFTLLRSLRMVSLIQILYLAEILGSYTAAMTVFTIFSFTVSLMEVPTGIVSDKIGRVKTLSLATIFRLLAIISLFLSYYFSPFLFAICYAVLIAIAVSLGSGTDEAIAFETVKQLKRTKAFPVFFGRISSMRPLGLAISALLGGYLSYEFSYHFVILIDLIPICICLVLCLFLVEPEVTSDKGKKNQNKGSIKKAWRAFSDNKKLKLISLSKVIKMGLRDAVYSFENLYFESIVPMWVVGIVRFTRQIFGAISFWFSGLVLNKFGDMKVLYLSEIINILIKSISILINFVATPFIYVSTNIFTSVSLSSFNNLSQKEFSDDQRATMGSLVSLVTNFTSGVFCILAGFLADSLGLQITMLILVLPNLILLPIYSRIFKKK